MPPLVLHLLQPLSTTTAAIFVIIYLIPPKVLLTNQVEVLGELATTLFAMASSLTTVTLAVLSLLYQKLPTW